MCLYTVLCLSARYAGDTLRGLEQLFTRSIEARAVEDEIHQAGSFVGNLFGERFFSFQSSVAGQQRLLAGSMIWNHLEDSPTNYQDHPVWVSNRLPYPM